MVKKQFEQKCLHCGTIFLTNDRGIEYCEDCQENYEYAPCYDAEMTITEKREPFAFEESERFEKFKLNLKLAYWTLRAKLSELRKRIAHNINYVSKPFKVND